ncbi:hypothetical protein GQ44DRAFT_429836 [Phaeosphaeriaceae sp. PMI808]|nr:hypothetical protein GQ44DRAFT_429836 [Phaeosphaeriaceae sp. PMI808]
MANDRARELERMYQMRRGHVPQISISDDNHHVTEAIGDLYGGDSDTEPSRRTSRPLSFVPSPNGDSIQSFGAFEPFDPFPTAPPARSPLRPQMATASTSTSTNTMTKPTKPATPTSPNGIPAMANHNHHNNNINNNTTTTNTTRNTHSHHNNTTPQGPLSPPLSRTNSDTASQQFPLSQLDYESSPAGLAQELSNLQAIRRMSMGVNNADPDLPSFNSPNGPPSPPAFSEDEDPSKLFWVPARLHPELAPMEFKTFIEEKVNTIRRRSSDSDSLSPDGTLGYQTSGAGLRRKKSMLSRQIDSGTGYKDGADRLERKRSEHHPSGAFSNLQELEHIVEDSAAVVRRMSLSSKRTSGDGEASAEGDVSMTPGKFGGIGTLKRSTRTTYRRGSLRKGGPPLSRRLITRQAETDTEESPSTSPTHPPDVPPLPLARVQSEPVNGQFEGPSNFSRPRRRSPPSAEPRSGSADEFSRPTSSEQASEETPRPQPKAFHSRIASNGRTSAHLPGYNKPPTLQSPVPQIIETPPPPQESDRRQPFLPPERHSSRQPPPQQQQQQQQPNGPRNYPQNFSPNQQRQSPQNRPNRHAQAAQASPIKPTQSFDDVVQHPAPLPGSGTRIDSLSIIPNLPEEKRSDKKSKDKKNDPDGPRKTSWGWLTGGDKDKEREKKEKEKEEREKELAKKVKNKLSKPQEKGHDDTRLDVLQTSIHGSGNRGRESVVLDRESIKLEEERKKESNRKTSSDGKKEKEPGLLSSIFGGGKKKSEKESSHKKASSRGLSPEPPPKILKPDIDYNWTRFSILEERAIYRMAHIKLANPRRELYSQVLLSNFMYSYLAKVQQMHPQIQIGNSKQARQAQQQQAAQQKKEQQQQQQQQQPEEFAQYQRYQQQQEQSEKNSEWLSAHEQQNSAGQRQSQENGHQIQRDQHGTASNQNPRDSHHSQHGANGGYSVANTQNYLGQGSKHGYHNPSDSDQSNRADDDMW